jgi:hypothetical protein
MNDYMVDLETLSLRPNAAIISIGAVQFDYQTGELGAEFYCNIDPASAVEAGGHIDADTVMWWMKQEKAARTALESNRLSIHGALEIFRGYLMASLPDYMSHPRIWGNGAAADNVWLATAYKNAGIELPWHFTDDRCYRTLKNLYPDVVTERTGVAHNALDDAKNQARHAIQLLRRLKGIA